MKDRISGTIVNVTEPAQRQLRPRPLWHLSRRPEHGYWEARPWFADPVSREYYEGSTKLLACSVEGARSLMPRGLEPAEDGTGEGGVWFSLPRAARRERAA